jgi:hypothetical protein
VADIFSDPSERGAVVNDVAATRGVAPWVIEKDLWVCWTLARLNEIADLPQLTFKGGTSLSKVHGLIDRFSEDIDLTFSRTGWNFDGERDPLRQGLSGKKRQALVDEIAERSKAVVRDVVVPGIRAACGRHIGVSGWVVEIAADDDQTVLFTFPSPTAIHGYGRPQVKIEFGARGDPWPTSRKSVRPYVEEVYEGTAPSAVGEVIALNPERTFWEKVTLLHALHHATLAKPDKGVLRLSRHIYDVHRIWHTPARRTSLLDRKLLQAVVDNKTIFFRETKARYESVTRFALNCAPHDALADALRRDFAAMGSMFFPGSTVPAFDEALETLKEIDSTVARWRD